VATIGIEWVNKYHGRASNLKNNDNNARAFYEQLDGVEEFEYGNDLAWDQDFEHSGVGTPSSGSDSLYADDVDIAFFSGHGSRTGLLFGVTGYDDGVAKNTEMRLGDKNLEWIVFDGCQALDYDGGDVFGRWGWPVFKGLHYILGFHTTCYDVKSRGKKFAKRLNDGWTVREAWIKACKETEGSGTHYAYLRANASGVNTYNDHWWGKGSVSGDPTSPSTLFHLHGPC